MKNVLLLLANGFEMYEASAYIDILGWDKIYGSKNIELCLCGISKELKSTFGVNVKVDLLIDEVDPEEFYALAIPGGFEDYGFYEDAYSEKFSSLIQKFYISHKTISSICVGALALGKSGILQNKRATTYNMMGGRRQKQLEEFGAEINNLPLVSDKNVTTSWSPVTAVDVAFKLLEELTDKKNVQYIRQIMGFGR